MREVYCNIPWCIMTREPFESELYCNMMCIASWQADGHSIAIHKGVLRQKGGWPTGVSCDTAS